MLKKTTTIGGFIWSSPIKWETILTPFSVFFFVCFVWKTVFIYLLFFFKEELFLFIKTNLKQFYTGFRIFLMINL